MSGFEIAVIRRQGALDEPELHIKSGVVIKEAWVFMPNYMPAAIRVKHEQEYRAELILPKGAFFQAIIDGVDLLIKNWHSGIVLVEMDSNNTAMEMFVYTSEVLTNHTASHKFGSISYMCVPVVIGQVARVMMDERV